MSPESPGESFFTVLQQNSRQLVLFQALDTFMQGHDPLLLVAPLIHLGIVQDSETLVDFARFSAVAQGRLPGEYGMSVPLPSYDRETLAVFKDLIRSLAYSSPNIEELYLQNNAVMLADVQFSTRFPRQIKELYGKVVKELQQQTDFDETFLLRRHQGRRAELHPSIRYTRATENAPASLTLGYSTRRRTAAPPPIPFEK